MTKQHSDMVNNPSHYASKDGMDIECIDAIHAQLGYDGFLAYCQGNIAKYLWRWTTKNGLQDLEKAQVYLEYMISEVKLQQNFEIEFSEVVDEELHDAAWSLATKLDSFSKNFDYYNYQDCVDNEEQNVEGLYKRFVTNSSLVDSEIEGLQKCLQDFVDDDRVAAQEASKLIAEINDFRTHYFGKVA